MKKILLLGSGELGKEFVISSKRLGCEVIACDNYANAPAMQLADSSIVLDMLDGKKLVSLVDKIKPDFIVPEIEAIRTEELLNIENKGITIVPSAKAVNLTMNRDSIRNRANELGIIKLSNDQRYFLWGSNNRQIMTVPFDEHPYTALAHWFKTDEGMEIYANIEKRLNS